MRFTIFFIFYFFAQTTFAKPLVFPADSSKNTRNKKIILGIGSGAAITGSLIYLNQAWYKSYSTGSFHLFNDNGEWLQMDKVGHTFSTYQVGRYMFQTMQWAGFTKNQSIFIGGTSGLAYMTAIEIMDGFSSGWGFSWGDMSANFAGSALCVAQQYFWNEQRIGLKYSFHQTSFPQYRPNLLGSNLSEQILKDYNGQTYWLSVNIASFLKKENKFPKWLNVALGYGASGMISGDNNYVYINSDGSIIGNNRYRKCFLSLDLDFTKIKTKSRFLKSVFSAINCFKIPFPAIELSESKIKGHYLQF